jgi:rubredoxin
MTLEEIERESAKLNAAERGKLAAHLLTDLELPASGEGSAAPDRCACPSCKKPTKRIEIETEAADWGRIYFLGALAAVHPDKQRARVCEHCGHVFDRELVTNPVTDRIAQFMFYVIPGIGMVWVIAMLVRAVMQ